jgi:hypothetical protein
MLAFVSLKNAKVSDLIPTIAIKEGTKTVEGGKTGDGVF